MMMDDEPIPLVDGQYWDIEALAHDLRVAREGWRAAHRNHSEHGEIGFPSRLRLEKIIAALCGALFPLRLGPSFVRAHNEQAFVAESLQTALSRLYGQIRLELGYAQPEASPHAIELEVARIISGFA